MRPIVTRRVLGLAIALSVLVSAFAASAQEPPKDASSGTSAKDGRQEVVFWHYMAGTMGQRYLKLLDRFNSIQDKYRLKPMLIPWNSNQKLLSSLAAGIPPDVIMIDRPAAPGWILRGALEDITPRVEKEGWSDKQFFTVPWRDCHYQDRCYLIPFHSDLRCLIYNKKLFREAGLDPERPPKTWDELYEYAVKLTTKLPDGRVKTLGFQGADYLILVLGWQLGGDLASPDLQRITMATKPYFDGLAFQRKLIDITGMDNYQRFLSSSGNELESQDAFFMGRVAMKLVEGFYLTRQRQVAPGMDVSLAAFPMPDSSPPISWISGFAFGMPTGCRNREGAWEFLKFIASKEVQTDLGIETGALPNLREAAYDPRVYSDPNRSLLIDMIDRCKYYPKVPVIMEAFNEICRDAQAVSYGRATPEEALTAGQKKVQESLDTYTWREKLPAANWSYVVVPVVGITVLGLLAALIAAIRYARRGVMSRNAMISGYLFASPWLLGLVLFTLGPVIVSFYFSFCDYQVLKPAKWAGLANYRNMMGNDPLFWKSLVNTLYYTVFSVPLGTGLALALAVLLNQPLRGMRIFRTIFYLPTLITGVAVSVFWMWILQPEYGVVNRALQWIGLPLSACPLWFGDDTWSKPALILMSLWGVGGSVIIFLAGLQGVPRQLYEAAEIDGAGPWRQFVHVTVPMLTPTIFFVVIVGIIGSFQVFTSAFIISGGTGGPLDSTLFYVLYLYRKGFEDFQMGYASAMAWGLFAVVFVLTAIQFRLSKKWVHY